jgi:hypothetical protein
MNRDKLAGSIWDLDPKGSDQHDYEEFVELFMDAWEYRFLYRPSAGHMQPYLHRYFRFRVIPPWVSVYVREVLKGEAIDNVANAPLDPVIDLRLFPWSVLAAKLLFPGRIRRKSGKN